MNIRRITRTALTSSIIGTVVVAGLASGSVAASSERCFEQGPNGMPQEVPCLPAFTPIQTPQFELPGFGDRTTSEPEEVPCTVTLPAGIDVPCDVVNGIASSDIVGPIGDIVFIPDAGDDQADEDPPAEAEEPAVEESPVEEPAVEESTVEQPAVEESGVEESGVEESAVEEPAIEEPAVEESAVEEPAVEEPAEESVVTEDGDVVDVESSEVDEPATGPLPSTGPAAAGILLGLGLMGIGGGAFAKLASSRRRH